MAFALFTELANYNRLQRCATWPSHLIHEFFSAPVGGHFFP